MGGSFLLSVLLLKRASRGRCQSRPSSKALNSTLWLGLVSQMEVGSDPGGHIQHVLGPGTSQILTAPMLILHTLRGWRQRLSACWSPTSCYSWTSTGSVSSEEPTASSGTPATQHTSCLPSSSLGGATGACGPDRQDGLLWSISFCLVSLPGRGWLGGASCCYLLTPAAPS